VTALAKAVWRARREGGAYWGPAFAVGYALLLAAGVFTPRVLLAGDLVSGVAFAAFAAVLARGLVREATSPPVRVTATLAETVGALELPLLLGTGVYVLVGATGGVASPLQPLVYALVSFLLIVHGPRRVGLLAVAWVALLQLLLATASTPARWDLAIAQLTFVAFFAAANLLVISGITRRLELEHERRVEHELSRLTREARDFRLIASQLPLDSRQARSREEEELRMAQGAVHAIHEQLFFTIDLLCSSLRVNTVALLWVDGATTQGGRASARLSIKEIATSSDLVRANPHLESPGILARLISEPKPMRLERLGGRRVPPYYDGPEPVTDLCAVPILDGQALRGFLCADRVDGQAFTDDEEAALTKAAQHVLRVIEHERAFAAVERGKYEQEQFYRASELLNQALTSQEVYERTFAAIETIIPAALVAVTSYDASAAEHAVLAVKLDPAIAEEKGWRELGERLPGLRFAHSSGVGSGLVAMAVKNRHHMPSSVDFQDAEAVVFDADNKLRKAKSLLVLPLMRGEQTFGTVVIASAKPAQLTVPLRDMLRVISHQVGVSLQNARMYETMQERATTDGLTGLTNRRAFQERFEQIHALAERTGQKFSLILTDIDHFKSVNDTYGHAAGDAVLKRVAAVFAGRARKVDVVARYGGEEFVLVLPDTDGEGAEKFANRLREEVAAQSMTSEHGAFKVTISMGVAEFPVDSKDRQDLLERADQALYWCKEHGRNCVTRWSPRM
jgi:diguanylate cyclase (GGDEF)-like protein